MDEAEVEGGFASSWGFASTLEADVEREFRNIELLTEDKVLEIAGENDAKDVRTIAMRVDTSEQSIAHLGRLVPNLREIKMSGSILASFRDFGSGFRNLKIIYLSRSGITDLDGVGVLAAVEELYLAFNDIRDVTPLFMHDNIQILDLESNRVEDMSSLDQLGTCPKLHTLNMLGNPVVHAPKYRRVVCHHIQTLQTLDDEPVSWEERLPLPRDAIEAAAGPRPSTSFGEDKETMLVADAIKYASVDDAASSKSDSYPEMIRRPASAESPTKAMMMGFESAPNTSSRPKTAHSSSASSALTHGSNVVFAGNPIVAMRRRRQRSRKSRKKKPRSRRPRLISIFLTTTSSRS